MRTRNSHRPWVAVMVSVAAVTLTSACVTQAEYRPDRPAPWLRAGAAVVEPERRTAAVAREATVALPTPRLKPPVGRRHAALAAEGRHVVVPGETLSVLAEAYGVPLGELARMNDLSPPFDIRVGQVLEVRPEPRASTEHVVQPGESLTVVAQRYGVPPSHLARTNDLERPDHLRVGQTLRIPQEEQPAAGVVRVVGPGAPRPDGDPWNKAANLPEDDGDGFLWPVNGDIVSTFGPKSGGRRNDGINIAARRGTPVRAAADGVVVYAGDAVRGYGQMVLLRHPDGYTTAYAHNAVVLVQEGQRVARGEVIARVGNTGSVTEPQLHFELRRNGQALDPLGHLQRATAVASSEN